MTENNTHLSPNHIQDLEKKYMEKIRNFLINYLMNVQI